MKRLCTGLLKIRVKPYYLHQCDAIAGSAHFRTPVSHGLDIIRSLHGYTTGYAVPTYMIDAPGGGGKVPVTPNYIVGRQGDDLVIKSYAGKLYRYHDAVDVEVPPALHETQVVRLASKTHETR
jgi:lysine 2,3-aminomutase